MKSTLTLIFQLFSKISLPAESCTSSKVRTRVKVKAQTICSCTAPRHRTYKMVLALTLTLVLTLELVQDSASQPYMVIVGGFL